jgi:hypothetical protein
MYHDTKLVNIDKKYFQVLKNEFNECKIYEKLTVLENLGYYERICSLINEFTYDTNITKNFLYINPTHGGFLSLECASHFENVYNYFTQQNLAEVNNIIPTLDMVYTHEKNIERNIEGHGCKNISFLKQLYTISMNNTIIFSEDENINWEFIMLYDANLPIIISKKNYELTKKYQHVYTLCKTDLYLYIPEKVLSIFKDKFYFFLNEKERVLDYDNLIHLCIMVKNAGSQFEEMLSKNLHIIDRWTILDTGSTDNTIEIINKVLVGKKKGELYQEPFINFRDSRNRCLELAGTKCKYTLMLDDTYVIEGNLREFLNNIRGDQFADSYSLYVKSHDMEYSSNRILKAYRRFKYIYRIHEIIQTEDNLNVLIPNQEATINDFSNEYMVTRTIERKEYDLKILLEEAELEPHNSRHIYYIAQTYYLLNKYELAYTYFLKRANHQNQGYSQECVDSLFEAARIAKYNMNLPWEHVFELYMKCYELDRSRPDALYFIAMHFYLEGDIEKAFPYFKKAFEIGYPIHSQFSLKPTLSFYFLPKYLANLCYMFEEYMLGKAACELFLEKISSFHNIKNLDTSDSTFESMLIKNWYEIYENMNMLKIIEKPYNPKKPYFVIVCDELNTKIIEYAESTQEGGNYQVILFASSLKNEYSKLKNGIIYLNLFTYIDFISVNKIEVVTIFNIINLLCVSYNKNIENVYLKIMNTQTEKEVIKYGIILLRSPKLKGITCYNDLDYKNFISVFKDFTEVTVL